MNRTEFIAAIRERERQAFIEKIFKNLVKRHGKKKVKRTENGWIVKDGEERVAVPCVDCDHKDCSGWRIGYADELEEAHAGEETGVVTETASHRGDVVVQVHDVRRGEDAE